MDLDLLRAGRGFQRGKERRTIDVVAKDRLTSVPTQ